MSVTMPDSFLGLDGRDAEYETARFAVLPIPYDATTSFSAGAREGPRAIIAASRQLEDYDIGLGRESIRWSRTPAGRRPCTSASTGPLAGSCATASF